MEHVIRRAVLDDRVRVEDLVAQAYEPWVPVVGARPKPMDADYAALIAAGQVHLAVEAATDGLDGLIVLIPEPDALLVENVAVRPPMHGRGIGRRLLAFADDEARRLGLPAVRLYTNEKMARNIALYDALGYTVTGRMPVEERGHIVLMRKDVTPAP
jgi:GNAT superfamily N-acetyltransferase